MRRDLCRTDADFDRDGLWDRAASADSDENSRDRLPCSLGIKMPPAHELRIGAGPAVQRGRHSLTGHHLHFGAIALVLRKPASPKRSESVAGPGSIADA